MGAWNKGLKENPATTTKRSELMKLWWTDPKNRERQSQSHKHMQDEKHNCWKGDGVGYHQLHKWMRKILGTPSLCTHCQSTTAKRFEWVNVSGEYLRVVDDWVRLCKKCHIAYDRNAGRWGDATKKFNLTESRG